jgi:hypothetical protein
MLSLFFVSVYSLTSNHTVSIGGREAITDFSRAYVLTNNFIGDLLGYGREDFIGLSFYFIDTDDIELIAVESNDGRMVGHMVSKHTRDILEELVVVEENSVCSIAKDRIGSRVICPLIFITWNEIEPLEFYFELPIPKLSVRPTVSTPSLLTKKI